MINQYNLIIFFVFFISSLKGVEDYCKGKRRDYVYLVGGEANKEHVVCTPDRLEKYNQDFK